MEIILHVFELLIYFHTSLIIKINKDFYFVTTDLYFRIMSVLHFLSSISLEIYPRRS
jgi:hypothetical protein